MFCKYCGKACDDDASFCPNCGRKIENGTVERDKKVDVDGFFGASEPVRMQQPVRTQQPDEVNPTGNGMAIAGFVCSFFIPLLGWIFGGIGLARANKRQGKGKGFSIAAIAIASVVFLIGLAD